MATNTEVAWSAGLFDGEGCITFGSRGQTRWRLVMTLTDRDLLDRFVAGVGIGRVLGPYTYRRNPEWKAYYAWRVTRRSDVRAVLRLLLPYLGARRSELARTVIADVEASLVAEIRRLHSSGRWTRARICDRLGVSDHWIRVATADESADHNQPTSA